MQLLQKLLLDVKVKTCDGQQIYTHDLRRGRRSIHCQHPGDQSQKACTADDRHNRQSNLLRSKYKEGEKQKETSSA